MRQFNRTSVSRFLIGVTVGLAVVAIVIGLA